MQEMSKFTPFKFHTDRNEYNEEQLEACEIVKQVARNPKYNYHNYTVYSTVINKLQERNLENVLTDDELYWLTVECWSEVKSGLDKVQ
tara:strand:+ start:277 stop:540 length:264 start_codon:yes stop_codon:yes gene_type:complete